MQKAHFDELDNLKKESAEMFQNYFKLIEN